MGSRVHRRVLAASVAAGLLLLATLVAVLVDRGGGGADNAAARQPHTASTPAARHPHTASTPAANTPAAGPAAARTVMVGPVVLDVPAGWAATTGYAFGDVCIAPQRARPMFGGCSGLQVFYGWDGFLPGEEMSGFSRRYPGWYHATDVQPCPVDPRGGDDYNGVQTGRQIGGEQLRPVGNRRAYYYRWIAGCQKSPYTFSPRAWYLPVSRVLMFDYIGYADVEPVIAHARFDDGSWQVGFVRHAGNSSIEFDDLQWRQGGSDFEPAKVHDKDASTKTLSTSPDVIVLATVVSKDADQVPGYRQRTLDWLHHFAATHPKIAFHVHLTAGGVVDRIVEERAEPAVR